MKMSHGCNRSTPFFRHYRHYCLYFEQIFKTSTFLSYGETLIYTLFIKSRLSYGIELWRYAFCTTRIKISNYKKLIIDGLELNVHHVKIYLNNCKYWHYHQVMFTEWACFIHHYDNLCRFTSLNIGTNIDRPLTDWSYLIPAKIRA